MDLPPFKLEVHFARWEFRARHHLTASDMESIRMSELLDLADDDLVRAWEEMTLGYTEVRGAPSLREAIAETYDTLDASDVLVLIPGEGITITAEALLGPEDHAVVVVPNYQSSEAVPASLCETTGVPLRAEDGWALDVDAVAAALRPNTKAVFTNFPNNPTGAVPSHEVWRGLVDLCADRDIYLFCDEIYRGVELDPATTLPQAADLYDKAVSLNGLSKSYGLPGLRIGWVATRDHALLDRIERLKHYGSICSSAPSEVLARIALRSRDHLLARSRKLLENNLPLVEQFFASNPELFEFDPPRGGCVSYPRYLGDDGVEEFCRRAVDEAGVLLLPASIYDTDLAPLPQDRFRIGLGRTGTEAGLAALHDFVAATVA